MSWKESTIGDVLSVIKNGINCEQNKNLVGNKITRIETISKKRFDFERVGYANLSESEKLKSQLRFGDILFSHINSPIHVGKTAIYEGEEDIYHGINLLLMRTKEEIDPYFFNHFLNHLFSTGYWEENCKKSVNQASVNQKDISKVPFRYPSLATQKKIVAKLDAIFAEIDKASAAAEANAKNAEVLFQNYLTQVFERGGEDWKEVKFSDILNLEYGKALPDFDRNDDGVYAAYGANGVKTRTNKCLYRKPSIIVGRKGSAGELTLVKDNFWALDVTYYVTHDENKTDLMYLYYALKTKNLTSYARGVKPGINRNDVYELEVPLPPLATQQKIVTNLDAILEKVKKLAKSNTNKVSVLATLKQSILKQAFTGELVKE